MIQALVFLPLVAALIAGLGNRAIGNVPAKLLTTGALFISCALTWGIFLPMMGGQTQPYVAHVLDFIHSGDLNVAWSLRVDMLTAVMLVVVTTVSALVHLYSRSEEHTSELQSLMRISYAVFCLKKKQSKYDTYHYTRNNSVFNTINA